MPELLARAEYLPAAQQARADLVLLHGWAGSSECWRPLLAALRRWANVTLIDWRPGADLADVVAEVLAVAPASAVYVGWSLGGQLATAVASRAPQRVAGLVTVASNPRFLAEGSWPGVAAAQLAGFQAGLAADAGGTLRRFSALQSRGCAAERALARQLVAQSRGWDAVALTAGLQWLAELDTRSLLPALACPQQHLLAEADALVPGAVHEALCGWLAGVAEASVSVIPGAGHALPCAAPGALAEALYRFAVDTAAVCEAAEAAPAAPVSKQAIALSFSRAAPRYDSVAALQRDVGERLLTSIVNESKGSITLLDLGCGTGYFHPALLERYPGAAYVGLDLAQGMLSWARDRHTEHAVWVAGDAEALPLASGSVDVIFSSLAFQWCYRPDLLFAELGRVLAPGGRCFFSSLGPATLQELRQSWAAADGSQHVNDFLPPETLQAAADITAGVRLTLRSERIVLRYNKATELLHELKTLGAHNMNSKRPAGLTGRQRLAEMVQAYEAWREPAGLPATYDVIYGHLEKL
ncbi:malonyl-ACP O-methyltransferase BioC [Haliea sp.]|uniref:malonyl-ACP O-methyltransferase BioC n=1 Tax=Haliea sp. TaxID=1932666 RepID=UPI0035271085